MRLAIPRQVVRAGTVLALFTALTWAAPQAALAHESREVGPYTFVVGFLNEPAYTHTPNGVSLRITTTQSDAPFEDLGDSLEAEVTFGDESFTSTLDPQFGDPGHYAVDFVPSRPGQWTFRFHGTVGDLQVDETFTSGPETFNDVEALSEASFPAQDPSTGELAERLEQELARVNDQIAELEGTHDTETTVAESTTDDSDTLARVLSAAALLVGAGALAFAFLVSRRQS